MTTYDIKRRIISLEAIAKRNSHNEKFVKNINKRIERLVTFSSYTTQAE